MASTTPPRVIKVNITSDSICPFCFIGKRKLDHAIEIAKAKGLNVQVTREFRPFLLDPSLKTDSALDKRAHYERKFGKDRFAQMEKLMVARGKLSGINFSYGGNVSQTTDSHRLLELAYERGGEDMQLALVEKLFNGYFEREQDIGSVDFLAEQAASVELFTSVNDAKAWLAGDEKKEEVARGIHDAQKMGITGVPFFVLDNRYAISGAEDSEVFVQVFERLANQKPGPNGHISSDAICA